MKKYDFILLDLDGPVLDGKARHYNCYRDIITEYAGIPIDMETYWEQKRTKVSLAQILEASKCVISISEFNELWLERIETAEYLKYDIRKKNIPWTLERLKGYCNKLYLVTMRNNHKNLQQQLTDFQLDSIFDRVVLCGSKESGGKYGQLRDKVTSNSLVIGDTEADIELADKIQADFVGIANGLRTAEIFDGRKYYNELMDINLEE